MLDSLELKVLFQPDRGEG